MLYIYLELNPSKQIIQPLECPKYFKVLLLFFQIDEELFPNFLVPKTFSEFPPHQRSLVSNHIHKQRLTTYQNKNFSTINSRFCFFNRLFYFHLIFLLCMFRLHNVKNKYYNVIFFLIRYKDREYIFEDKKTDKLKIPAQ
jgi:hypothetical protein